MAKAKIATVWLDGCSGCHMSFLDIDERLIAVLEKADLVYSPLVDAKEFPEGVDVTFIEGAVATDEDLHKIKKIRARTKILVSLGDCAVTSNVPAMRNPYGVKSVMQRAYFENATYGQQIPREGLPTLLERVRPVHEVVNVDVFVPGCPPSADTIYEVVADLLEGRHPVYEGGTRFGA